MLTYATVPNQSGLLPLLHYLWMASSVFLYPSSPTFLLPGMVLFLEEDHYVSDDFLHVLSLVDAERTSRYPNCDIICLGTYLKSYNYKRDQKSVSSQVNFRYTITTQRIAKGMKVASFCRVNMITGILKSHL